MKRSDSHNPLLGHPLLPNDQSVSRPPATGTRESRCMRQDDRRHYWIPTSQCAQGQGEVACEKWSPPPAAHRASAPLVDRRRGARLSSYRCTLALVGVYCQMALCQFFRVVPLSVVEKGPPLGNGNNRDSCCNHAQEANLPVRQGVRQRTTHRNTEEAVSHLSPRKSLNIPMRSTSSTYSSLTMNIDVRQRNGCFASFDETESHWRSA